MITCPFNSIPICIPLQYNEANLYALYDKFLVALSTEQRTFASKLYINLGQYYLDAETVPSTSFAVLVTLLRRDVQKGTVACMKENNRSKTHILLLAEIGWGTVLK